MKKKPKSRSSKIDFISNRLNKYSIRKFTVGTASILVGATLLFGLGDEAKADELSNENAAQAQSKNSLIDEDSNQKDMDNSSETVNESSTEDRISEVTSTGDNSTEVDTTKDITTKEINQEVSQEAPEIETTKEASTEVKAQEVETTEEANTEEKAPETKTTEEASTEVKTPEIKTTEEASAIDKSSETPVTDDVNTEKKASETLDTKAQPTEVDRTQVVDAIAKDLYSKSEVTKKEKDELEKVLPKDISNLSNKEIKKIALSEKLKETASKRNAQPRATFRSATALRAASPKDEESLNIASNELNNSSALIDNSKVIEADAIKNGYINSQTDATNAANTLSGRAWIVDKGTPATMSNGLTPVPEGTKVYLQWIDKDGAVSPTYMARTTNQLSTSDGSQVGPGAYAFDLREGWTDAAGNVHKYSSINKQLYRLWIEDFEIDNGITATMIRQAGGFYPGSYVDSVTHSNIGQFPLVGTNMQRTGIFMGVKYNNDYMTKDKSKWIHDEKGPIGSPWVDLNAKNSVSGQVWFETGDGDYANSATGPNNNIKDPEAAGYTVVMSSLTPEGAQQYKAQIEGLHENEKVAAVKQLLEQNPDYISATVYGETDEQGRYTLRFPEGSLNTDYIFGYIMDPEGNFVNAYSSYTSPQFRAPNSNLSWTPQAAPAQNYVASPMWYNVHFALVPSNDINLDVLEYNNTDKPAIPGDKVKIDLIGANLSPLPTRVEWRDKNGKVVQKTDDIKTLADGEQQGTFIVPDSAVDGDIYTAYLVVGENDVAADSFIVKVTDSRQYEPTTNGVTKEYGTPTTSNDVTGAVTIPDYPADKEQPTITVDDETQLPDGNTPGMTEVDVTVTYPDGTKDHIKVPVTVGKQADNDAYEPRTDGVKKDHGTPITSDDVTGAVTIPNYPADKEQPMITIDDESQLPDGNTPGTTEVDVTVTYPDGTKDHIKVPVTVGKQADNDAYNPTTNGVTKEYGTPTTSNDVTGAVTIPNYPADKGQPTITVDDESQLPDGNTPGTTEVDVTVTYPDGTKDHIKVPVTVGKQADNDAYEPRTDGVKKDHGTPITSDDVTGAVTIPNYPADKEQPMITIDDESQLPDGNTPGTTEVDVTVTYPDGTKDHIKVPVTVGKQADNDAYNPTTNGVTKEYGTPTTSNDVTGAVTIPNYPADKGQPTITVDDESQLPDGNTPGTTEVDVTVTYPDGTKDHIKVPVTVGKQADNDAYEPRTDGVKKDHGTPITSDDVTGAVTIPNYPADKEQPMITIDDESQLPDGNTPGTTEVDVTVTYPDGTKDHIKVPVTVGKQADNDAYNPTTNGVTKEYGTPTTSNDVTGAVTIPNYPADKGQPTITVDDESQLPDGNTPGTTEVDVTVTYPDGTKDHIKVPVTVGKQADNDAYEPRTDGVKKDHGTPITSDDVTGAVTIPNYPADKEQPMITIDDESQLPDGNTPGTTEVDVTVTYPDGTKDHIKVPVTVGKQADNDAYNPTTNGVTKEYGTPTTSNDVTGAVTIPNYPADKGQPTITVDDESQLPDGNTPGTTEVDVTVTYPDGTKDHIKVPVTVGKQADNDAYEPRTDGVKKDHGTPITSDDVTGAVTIPNYPADKEQPMITIDDESQLPDGNTPGTTEVDVTVTYPDGTKDHIKVPVTVGKEADNDAYEPKTDGVKKDHGTPTTSNDVTGAVTIPNYPADKEQPMITIDDESQLPDGNTPGTTEVDVTVTYPDGTKDHIKVPVTVGKQADNDAYEPKTDGVKKDHGTPITSDDVTGAVTIPNYPADKEQPMITVDDESQLPDGNTPGTKDIDVTVTYPDGTKDHIKVPVTVGKEADNDAYEPKTDGVKKDHGTPITSDDVTGAVTIPNYPADKEQPMITVDDESQLPDGNTPGTKDIDVTVTYPDGTKDHIKVPVTVGKQADNDAYEPRTDGVKKDHGTPITSDDVTGAVTIPNYPADKEQPMITIDDESQLPYGNTPGTKDIDVTVTYPDGTKDHIKVPVTVGDVIDLPAPSINPIDDDDTAITGSNGTPGNTIVITFPDGTTSVTKVDGNGNWSVEIPNNVDLAKGDVVTGIEKDNNGNESEISVVIVVDTDSDSDSNSIVHPDSDTGIPENTSDNNSGKENAKAISMKDHNESNNEKALPDTGEQAATNTTLFGGLIAGIGSLFLFGRRRKDNKESN
ncbi:Rib/alpha-like domain-containing protein [Mammaliicoccus sciuri]|uniref:Rib/alpha-like domain-containing protein n=1 Tax=Mammaliicoccus sciuri TaxID=1296 RepID=UPI00397DFFC1